MIAISVYVYILWVHKKYTEIKNGGIYQRT